MFPSYVTVVWLGVHESYELNTKLMKFSSGQNFTEEHFYL